MVNNLVMIIKMDADTLAFASLLVSVIGTLAAIFAAFYANIAASYAKKAASKRDLTPVEQSTRHVEHFSNKILSIDTPIHPQEKQEDSPAQARQELSPFQAERKTSPALQEISTAQARPEGAPVQVSQVPREGPPAEAQREVSRSQSQEGASQAKARAISVSVEGEALGEDPLELFLTLQDSAARVSRVETLGKAGKALVTLACKATDNARVFKATLASKKVRQWWDEAESSTEGEGRSVLRVYLLSEEGGREVYRDIPVSVVDSLRNVGITTLVVWTIKGGI
jgi:hypothetical protein